MSGEFFWIFAPGGRPTQLDYLRDQRRRLPIPHRFAWLLIAMTSTLPLALPSCATDDALAYHLSRSARWLMHLWIWILPEQLKKLKGDWPFVYLL